MAFSLHGVHVPHRKNTAGMAPVRMPVPKTVVIPTSMHIGKPAAPCVKVGSLVCVGDLIAEQNGFISSPIYASVSGKVTKIDNIVLSNGSRQPAVTITSDGEMTVSESIKPPVIECAEDLLNAIKLSGMVGLGGAGFPTYVKFAVGDFGKIEELIINGAECEPYITSDSVIMEQSTEDIALALKYFEREFGIKRIIFGIEKNKPEAIKKIKELAAKDSCIEVKVLPSMYPQGGEKVLVYHTTGKIIKAGKLPIDVGCVVCNSTTVASIGKYIRTGMPLVEKCITVDGGAVKNPQNVIAPIGTSLADVFEFCGGFKEEPAKVIYGGPMMGITVPSLDAPVIKNTNAVLALTAKEAAPLKTTACISCGACVNHCPFGINPALISKALRVKDTEAIEKLGVNSCMECGCCSFICPANRPLVQNNKLAKALLREAKAKEEKK